MMSGPDHDRDRDGGTRGPAPSPAPGPRIPPAVPAAEPPHGGRTARGNIVDYCSQPGCGFATAIGDRCLDHLHPGAPGGPLHLTDDDIIAIRAQVERDAEPLFVAALAFIFHESLSGFPGINVSLFPTKAAELEDAQP